MFAHQHPLLISFRSSYNKDSPFPKLMNDAICLPLFDGGNVGVRRRQLERLFLAGDYKPWASTYK